MGEQSNHIQCLLCQAKVAPNHYELDDCLELIEEMSGVLKGLLPKEEVKNDITGTFYGLTLRD